MERHSKLPRKDPSLRVNPWCDVCKTVLSLVLPHLVPGQYVDQKVMFRTYLALNHTCQRMRYWLMLRRLIGWFCNVSKRSLFFSHGFPVPLSTLQRVDIHLNGFYDAMVKEKALENGLVPKFETFSLLKAFGEKEEKKSRFELDVAGVPFFNLARCSVIFDDETVATYLCFRAATADELLLFCSCLFGLPKDSMSYTGYFIFCSWKSPQVPYIHVLEKDRTRFVERTLMGLLKKMLIFAPVDAAFQFGAATATAFSHFMTISEPAEGGGRRKRAVIDKFQELVRKWSPSDLFSRDAAIQIPIKFCEAFY
jgi:hypothetical protein